MKTVVNFFLSLGLLLMTSQCLPSLPEEDKIAYALLKRTTKRLHKKYHVTIAGLGGCNIKNIFNSSVTLQRYGEPLTLEKARALIVKLVQEYLKDMDEDEKLRPYLTNYPCSLENISVTVINYYPNGNDVIKPYIGSILQVNNKIIYYIYDTEDIYVQPTKIRETYEEALAILNQQECEN